MSETFKFKELATAIGGKSVLTLLDSGNMEIVKAVADNKPFPDGEFKVGGLQFGVNREVKKILPRTGASITFGADLTVPVIGLYKNPDSLISDLAFQDARRVGLTISTRPDERLLLFKWKYNVAGSVSGTHPIGAFGTLKAAGGGTRGSAFCVVCRVGKSEGACDAVRRTIGAFRLPRFVGKAGDMAEGSMIIAEVEGGIAAELAATVGYDFSFLREVKNGGLQGDIGLKVVAGLQAKIGFEASGRYILAVERTGDVTVRVRLFEMSHSVWDFGYGLAAKAQCSFDLLPAGCDDLVAAIFGTHGLQVMKELERWTDPDVPLTDLIVGITSEQAAELIGKAGVKAVELVKRLGEWKNLTDSVKAALWKSIDTINKAQNDELINTLKGLATGDDAALKAAIAGLLERTGLAGSPIGEILEAAAGHGLRSLLDRVDIVRDIARKLLVILDGDVMANLKSYINDALDLTAMLENPDQEKMSDWLIGRLAAFLDTKTISGKLNDAKLKELRAAANTILEKRQNIYDKIREALEQKYTFDLAARFDKSTEKTALIDATFDTSRPEAVKALKQVLRKAKYDAILLGGTPGVSTNMAELSHGVRRSSSIAVQFPFYNTTKTSFTEAMAKVRAKEDCGRVLFYETDASDTVAVKNRMTSQLWSSMSFHANPGLGVRIGDAKAQIGYRRSLISVNAKMSDMLALLKPFVDRYMKDIFAGEGQSLETYLIALGAAIDEIDDNGPNKFGDVLLSQEVTLPGSALLAWFNCTNKMLPEAKKKVSLRLQRELSRALYDSYFADVNNYRNIIPAQTLLAWCAIQPSTEVILDHDRLKEKEKSEKVFWNYKEPHILEAMLRRDSTISELGVMVADARSRLEAQGKKELTAAAEHYKGNAVQNCLNAALSSYGKTVLDSLFFSEAEMVSAVCKSLEKISDAVSKAGVKPGDAIKGFAEAMADLMKTFHSKLKSVFETKALKSMAGSLLLNVSTELSRSITDLLLLETSKDLDSELDDSRLEARLELTVLKEQRTYDPKKYLEGQNPPLDEIVLRKQFGGGKNILG